MPHREGDEKKISLTTTILSSLVDLAAGKPNQQTAEYLNVAKSIWDKSGADQKMTQWLFMTALSNPDLTQAIFKVRSFINDRNAQFVYDHTISLLDTDSVNAQLLGIVAIAFISKRFAIQAESVTSATAAINRLLLSDELLVKNAAIVCLEILGDTKVTKQDVLEAKIVLREKGFDF